MLSSIQIISSNTLVHILEGYKQIKIAVSTIVWNGMHRKIIESCGSYPINKIKLPGRKHLKLDLKTNLAYKLAYNLSKSGSVLI